MKIAFVGKGGSGKTTLSSLFCRHLAKQGNRVLAIDADINQHLAAAIGLPETESVPPLGLEVDRVKEYLRGNNPRISSNASMIKTTPPGKGSRLLTLKESNPIFDYFQKHAEGVAIMATGPFGEEDLGVKCYHSKVGAVELILNHLIDGDREYVVVDMTAGADSFASGMFTKFDLTFIVVEPTLKSISVYEQYKHYAQGHNILIRVIGNKIESQEDLDFIRTKVGTDFIGQITKSQFVKAMEKGQHQELSQLESENLQTLSIMQSAVDGCRKNWAKFYADTIDFHLRNAKSWANEAVGQDLAGQVDPEFELLPQAIEKLSVR